MNEIIVYKKMSQIVKFCSSFINQRIANSKLLP